MPTHLSQLRQRLAEIHDLGATMLLLGWDQQVIMPPAGAEARAEALGTLGRIEHELYTSAETGRLLEAAAGELDGLPDDADDVRLVRNTQRVWEKARRVPTELAAEMVRAHALGESAWEAAKEANDFTAFDPYLTRNLELARRYAECFDGFDSAYDALLDDYEPGLTTAQVTEIFDELKAEIVPVVRTLSELPLDDSVLHGHFPVQSQRELARRVVGLMGFDDASWRMDESVHPFEASPGLRDVRITCSFDEGYIGSAIFTAMHESGHGLYESSVDPALARTPLAHIESYTMHESQSRMWENVVGRGRAFAQALAPMLREQFPDALGGLEPETLYRSVNRVTRSLIRIEADEASYGLHVMLRFELERELIAGRLSVAELRDAWNAKMQEYLGLDVPDDAHGAMQDVHWSGGSFGYFPSYALGNLVAAQLWAKVRDDIPDLEAQLAAGELGALRGWLRENVHRHGSKFTTAELLERVVGGPLQVAPFAAYLKGKLSDVYRLELA
jgi:carboxypeptidase Taq